MCCIAFKAAEGSSMRQDLGLIWNTQQLTLHETCCCGADCEWMFKQRETLVGTKNNLYRRTSLSAEQPFEGKQIQMITIFTRLCSARGQLGAKTTEVGKHCPQLGGWSKLDTSLPKRVQSCDQWCRVDRFVPGLRLQRLLLLLFAPLPHHPKVLKHIEQQPTPKSPTHSPKTHTPHTQVLDQVPQLSRKVGLGTFQVPSNPAQWNAGDGLSSWREGKQLGPPKECKGPAAPTFLPAGNFYQRP